MAKAQHFDIAIIGGGSGLTAAHYAVQDGKSVALIDDRPDQLGGTCLNRGCIPTKGLIQSANVMQTVRDAARFGIHLDESSIRVDFPSITKTVRDRRERSASGVRSWVESEMTPFFGRARFAGEKRIEMDDGRTLTAENVFLATGASPNIPPIDGIESVDYLTNESVLELTEQPASLIILGGGYIGCEFGHFFASLGTAVTVVDTSEHCLLREDEDIRRLFTEEFGKRADLVLGARATKAERRDGGVALTVDQGGSERTLEATHVLVATGRRPNSASLNLGETGVETDEKGWITVDDRLRTSHPDIFSYGDAIGAEMFKHTSSYEGLLAYRNAHGDDRAVDYSANPHAIFAHPEIAAVGLTESECAARGLDFAAASHPYKGIAKGQILGDPPGLVKAIVEKGSRRILGFHMAGPDSAILIQEVVTAMTAGATADLITDAIHVHPAMPELIEKVFGKL